MRSMAGLIEVWLGDRRYFVHLPSEAVYTEVVRRGAAINRRVVSARIVSACVLRASDKAHGVTPGRVAL